MEQAWYTILPWPSKRGKTNWLTRIGTCISTLETRCYDEYYPQQEVVDYFDKAVEVFERLPSYKVRALGSTKLCTKLTNRSSSLLTQVSSHLTRKLTLWRKSRTLLQRAMEATSPLDARAIPWMKSGITLMSQVLCRWVTLFPPIQVGQHPYPCLHRTNIS